MLVGYQLLNTRLGWLIGPFRGVKKLRGCKDTKGAKSCEKCEPKNWRIWKKYIRLLVGYFSFFPLHFLMRPCPRIYPSTLWLASALLFPFCVSLLLAYLNKPTQEYKAVQNEQKERKKTKWDKRNSLTANCLRKVFVSTLNLIPAISTWWTNWIKFKKRKK